MESRLGIGSIPFVHFENGVNSGLFRPDGPSMRESLGVDPLCFLAGYAGADNPEYDFPAMIEGAAIAAHGGLDLRLLFAGSKSLHDRIRKIDAGIGLGSRSILIDRLPHSEVPALIRALDAGLVVWREDISHMGPTALKLKEMLLAGVPVISNLPACWRSWPIAPAIWGIERVTPQAIAVALGEIAADRREARSRAIRGGDIVRNRYSWSAVGRSYGERLASMVLRSAPEHVP